MTQELIRISNEHNNQRVIVFSSEHSDLKSGQNKRDQQRVIILDFLKCELSDQKLKVVRDSQGAPRFLNRAEELSISHSGCFYALQIRQGKPVGIDIQVYKKDIAKGIFYFVNDEEQRIFEMSLVNLHLIWSAKEAVYKLFKGDVERYKEDLTIVSIDNARVQVRHKKEIIEFNYQLEKDFILVYAS